MLNRWQSKLNQIKNIYYPIAILFCNSKNIFQHYNTKDLLFIYNQSQAFTFKIINSFDTDNTTFTGDKQTNQTRTIHTIFFIEN